MKLSTITLKGNEIALRPKEDVVKGPGLLSDVYDRFAKLVFIFDCSSSMNEQMTTGYLDHYIWSEDLMTRIREAMQEAYADVRMAIDQAGPLYSLMVSSVTKILFSFVDPNDGRCEMDDAQLRKAVAAHSELISHFEIPVNWEKHSEKPPTRMDTVRKLAKQEIDKRIAARPEGQLAVVAYSTGIDATFNDGTQDDLWKLVNGLEASGGTDTLAAIRQAMEMCAEKPSTVGVHHFILVSDGEDHALGASIERWVPALKQSGVILDYIHIGDAYSKNEGMIRACEMTGGEFVMVDTVAKLEEKFVEAVSRRCLPPAS